MLKNYLKITFAVLKRRKFFTFISLFGISFTLLILVIITAFIDHLVSAGYPDVNRDRSLYIERMVLQDTTQQGMNSSPVSLYFIKNYVFKMTTPEMIAYSTYPNTLNAYSKQNKIKLMFRHTDENFWNLTSFDFIEGKPYTKQNIDNNDYVVVINDDTRDKYFGKGVSVVGKTLELDNVSYRIIGVVRGCPVTRIYVASDVYLPYNTAKRDQMAERLGGSYLVFLLAKSKDDFPAIKAEYQSIMQKVPLVSHDKWFKPNRAFSTADTYVGSFLSQFMRSDGDAKLKYLYMALVGFALLFMSLPAINLVNVNISRIMERASEIGIRKAFGASSMVLTYQFIIENIILTLIGGIIALVLSVGVIYFINTSGMINYADLAINWKVFIIAILVSLVFGLLSGVYPAWRMSRLQVVTALRGGE